MSVQGFFYNVGGVDVSSIAVRNIIIISFPGVFTPAILWLQYINSFTITVSNVMKTDEQVILQSQRKTRSSGR